MSVWSWLVVGLQLASRLAYVMGVGTLLNREKREGWFTRRYGEEEGFRRFRRIAALLMNTDGIAFALACLATRGTLGFPGSPAIRVGIGLVAIAAGAGIKLWARRTLGPDAYYWQDFFIPSRATGPVARGPYRFLSNPMYTVGYLHAYGIALALDSAAGLALAAFAQAAVLVFYRLVERPHFRELEQQTRDRIV